MRRDHPKTNHPRAGASLLQVLTCLLAIAGGVYVGTEYMGVTVNDLAYTALDETQMLDQLPEDWRPQLSDCPVGDCPERVAPNEEAAELRAEFENMRLDAAKLHRAAKAGETPDLADASDEQRALVRDTTIAYWGRLCEIANQVAEVDDRAKEAFAINTTGHVFELRRRAFDYGARAIEAIELDEVDPQAIEAGNRLIEWYREGANFYQRATGVWDSLAGGEGDKADQDALEKTRLDRGKQTELLRTKLAELSRLLTRRHAVEFPPLGV